MDQTQQPSHIQKELQSLCSILQLTHHRNNNQHRLSKWYKSLSTFRRQSFKLLDEVKVLDNAIAFASRGTATKKSKQKDHESAIAESKYVREAREKIEVRIEFWEQWQLERWFEAFSNLTADVQYAALGLMLLGCLARARSLIWQFSTRKMLKDDQSKATSENGVGVNRGDEDDMGQLLEREHPILPDEKQSEIMEDDLGKIVSSATSSKQPSEAHTQNAPHTKPEKKRVKRALESNPVKKKRRKADAFDNLFSNLL